MLSCKDLVERSSDYLDGQLRLRERLGVRAHLAMCVHCRRFIRQLKLSQAVLRQPARTRRVLATASRSKPAWSTCS